MCFAQVKPGSTRYVEWIERHTPATLAIVVTTVNTRVGRHSVQGMHWEGSGFASSRRDQQTEQSQSSGCGRCRYLLGSIGGHLPFEALLKAEDQLGVQGTERHFGRLLDLRAQSRGHTQLELGEGAGVIHRRNPLGRRSTYPGQGRGGFCGD